ncbi:MAG: potassium channel beta subunit family protein [Spirochaetia bacterium]
MEYNRLGRSGLKVSELSFGSWVTFSNQLEVDNAKKCMYAAYDAGVNFFDNAEVYAKGESERIMGKVLAGSGWRRDSFIVSSKVFGGAIENPGPTQRGLSRKHVFEAAHQAMERLQVDYLDLYFCHRPDQETPIEETVFAMTDLIRQGKVLYWGTSEWSAQELMQAYSVARQYNQIPPTMEQPQYNLFHRERFEKEYRRLYSEIGLGTTIWSPLGSGLLTGKYNDGIPEGSRATLPGYEWLKDMLEKRLTPETKDKLTKFGDLAKELGMTQATLAIAWCLKNPNVSTVITGASREEQVHENMKAAEEKHKLTDDVMERIEEIFGNKPDLSPA